MAAAYGHGAAAVNFCLLDRDLHGAQHQPGTRQTLSVPGEHGAMIGQRDRLTLEFHLTRFDVLQIGGEQLQAVGVVAEQVGFDQDVGDVMGAILRHPGCDQQRFGELDQRGSVMARPGAALVEVGGVVLIICCGGDEGACADWHEAILPCMRRASVRFAANRGRVWSAGEPISVRVSSRLLYGRRRQRPHGRAL